MICFFYISGLCIQVYPGVRGTSKNLNEYTITSPFLNISLTTIAKVLVVTKILSPGAYTIVGWDIKVF